ncbi:MAG: glycosyltransferase [Actinobacteria bacterium]|uniref:Unannotated protein n=1 Tax=freshwater metagenome TaxID=449393 RepID=A0A6J6QB40_9ZZZZ|nr:glycosyltransferase [Actinomycetota bacterium]
MTTTELTGRRIAVVNWRDLDHSLAGGSERYAWEFAQALREGGAEVEFITARDAGQSRTEVCDGIRIHRGGGAFGFYAFAAWSLLRRRRRLDAVVDPECGIPSFSPLFVRRSTPVVLVVHHVHQAQFATYFPAPLARFGQLLERVVMPRVYRRRTTVAVSESTRLEMVRQLGWTGPVGLLANGATMSVADTTTADKQPERLVVLGRLVPHKRVDLVLRAVAALRPEHPGLRVDVVGKGPEQGRLEALVAELGLGDCVQVHGFVSEQRKDELLQAASLQVCASDIEGWGQVVLEAAAYGVPTLARDVPGLRDSVRPGETGWLVPDAPGDLDTVLARLSDQLRDALRHLHEPEEHTLTVKACQAWAAEFSWERMRRQARELIVEELRRA